METVDIPVLYVHEYDESDTFAPVAIVELEDLTDEEAEEYANSLSPEEAKEHLSALMDSYIV